jgi:hypothetical protein
MIHASGKREVARAQAMAGREQSFAGPEIESLNSDMPAGSARLLDFDAITVTFGVFLNNDGVRALRHYAAGKDARRFAALKLPRERPAGGNLADDLQLHRRVGCVGGAYGVAVHGGNIRRRLRAPRRKRIGKDAALGIAKRDLFSPERGGLREHAVERLGYR